MERHRIDTWLKLVCLFKHRADATEACRGGKVRLNGQRARPAAAVKEGDVVEFATGDWNRKVVVVALPETNVSKEAARSMYLDQSPPRPAPAPAGTIFRDRGAGRPTKKERRETERFRR